MDVVKIKCGNSFSENEVKGHQPVLTVFYILKTKKANLQSFLDFSVKFQFLLLNIDIYFLKTKIYLQIKNKFYAKTKLNLENEGTLVTGISIQIEKSINFKASIFLLF
jgi:hypothetical protein